MSYEEIKQKVKEICKEVYGDNLVTAEMLSQDCFGDYSVIVYTRQLSKSLGYCIEDIVLKEIPYVPVNFYEMEVK